MKFSLVIFAVVGLACGAVVPKGKTTRDIHSDIQDFINLVPRDEVLALVLDHLANDDEVKEGLAYLQSEDFKHTLQKVESDKVLKALLDDLQNYDLDAYGFINRINDFVGIEHIRPENPEGGRHVRSIKSLINDIIAVIPMDEILALYEEKMENSQEWSDLIEHLQSEEFKKLVDDLRANEDEQVLEKKLAEYDINVDEIIQLIKNFLGWR